MIVLRVMLLGLALAASGHNTKQALQAPDRMRETAIVTPELLERARGRTSSRASPPWSARPTR